MIVFVRIEVQGRWLSYGCRKPPMDQYANYGTIVPKVCNLTNHANSEKHQHWAPVQCQARLNINFEKNFLWYSCNLDVSLWQRNGNTTKNLAFCLAFFWCLIGTIRLSIEIFIWQPWLGDWADHGPKQHERADVIAAFQCKTSNPGSPIRSAHCAVKQSLTSRQWYLSCSWRVAVAFTSTAQPIKAPFFNDLIIILKRFLGASLSAIVSVTPPVKSSIASVVLPPFRAS